MTDNKRNDIDLDAIVKDHGKPKDKKKFAESMEKFKLSIKNLLNTSKESKYR